MKSFPMPDALVSGVYKAQYNASLFSTLFSILINSDTQKNKH